MAIVVADVVGHGVASSDVHGEAIGRNALLLAADPDIAKAVARLNDRMSALRIERFVTFLLMVIDPSRAEIQIVERGAYGSCDWKAKEQTTV